MIFTSLQYLLFLPLVVILYRRTKGSVRNWFLIAASYYFYMSWFPVYGLLLFALTSVNWILGEQLYRSMGSVESDGTRSAKAGKTKVLFAIGLAVNLGCLFYYKYTNFALQTIADTFNLLVGAANSALPQICHIAKWDIPIFDILLPLAVSFFVFEFIHYLIDIYKGDKPVKSFQQFMVFASFFPSQIAGPIKRYQDFIKRLNAPEPWSSALVFEAIGLFVQGLFKKVAIADTVGSLIYYPFNNMLPLSAADAWLISIGFVVQVYCDFSAYTDMARGSALLLGIRLPENFNLPYLATDLADFWRRWHISLSSWLRDYVYIPLGGSRKRKKDRLLNWRNLFLTMVACGLWHGVGWHYIVFGAMQGVGLIVNREWRLFLHNFGGLESKMQRAPIMWFNNFLTMLFIMLNFIIFRAPDMDHAFNVLNGLVSIGGECTLIELMTKHAVIPIIIVYCLGWLITEYLKKNPEPFSWLRDEAKGYGYPLKLAFWTSAVILTVAARPMQAVPFVYFQF